ncbi:metal ABC transporter permease [Salmonella enterica subsp. enterica serovar Infantis]
MYCGDPLAIGAFIAGLFCAIATGYLDDNSRIKRDTVMGIVFSGMFGAGLVLYVSIQSEVHLRSHPVWGYAGRIAGGYRTNVSYCTGYCVNHWAEMERSPATRF